jgi:hypothetical protein
VLLVDGAARLAGLAFPPAPPPAQFGAGGGGGGLAGGDWDGPLRRGEAEWLYLAPELMRPARAHERGAAADAFAWALLAVHLCAGAPPWSSPADAPARGPAAGRVPSRAELVRLVGVRRARPAIGGATPGALRAAIERCWPDDPPARARPADLLPGLLAALP